MLVAWVLVIVGVIGLVWSADRFVAGSAAIARNMGVSKMVVGLTIVSLGTSAPEIIVSIDASLVGIGTLAIGNALGSNIANIGLVLSITALIAALPIQRHLLTQEIPTLLVITGMAGIFLYDGEFKQWEGFALLFTVVPLIYLMYRVKKNHPEDVELEDDIPTLSNLAAAMWFVIGLVLLVVSARMLVSGADTIARNLGVSELVIGLTVVAIGTSLPELAASVASALKGHHDIAIGNIIGSNIFNILTVMSIPGIVGIGSLEDSVFSRDYMATAFLTGLLSLFIFGEFLRERLHPRSPLHRFIPMFWGRQGKPSLGRVVGVILLLCYVGYSVILFYSNSI